ncbi:NAD(P)H oxidoreductase YRKL [Vibrio ishigakensis]|uniref:NAD(P)H oxidoreductase YRKL n=1 Tax=Vibrio ishigakensis TaxID=1481914 RepID=A0A0B8PDH1_9VIBR|nr:NAD(P)H oxidoreductase YRKL [Vibrio ishigakensis]
MNILVVYWHPEPKSFNGALFNQAVNSLKAQGHQVKTSDLHAMEFNPTSGRNNFTTVHDPDFFKQQLEEMHATDNDGFAPEIETELQKLEWADLVIFQFPLWWFGLPAVLKGWVDRVFAMARTYGRGRIYETGPFKGKKAMLSLTMGGGEEIYVKGGWNGDLMGILRPIHRGIFEFNGYDVLEPFTVYGPARMSDEERKAELERFDTRLKGIFNESKIDVGEY